MTETLSAPRNYETSTSQRIDDLRERPGDFHSLEHEDSAKNNDWASEPDANRPEKGHKEVNISLPGLAIDVFGADAESRLRSVESEKIKAVLETARELLETGHPRETIGLCSYLEARFSLEGAYRAWGMYFKGKAMLEIGETNQGVRLLEESLADNEISYSALALADYFLEADKHDKALTYYSFALKWPPTLEVGAKRDVENKLKQVENHVETKRLLARLHKENARNSDKLYVNPVFCAYPPTEDVYGALQDNPLVSILIVSYNSNADLKDCYDSILRQTYQNWEVVIVDNSDKEDASSLTMEILGERAIYIRQPNIGFASANNVAASFATGDLFLLLNPDAALADGAIKQLVSSLRFDGSAGLVAPKIFFTKEFLKLTIYDVPQFIRFDSKALTRNWNYKKIFIIEGEDEGRGLVAPTLDGRITLEVPIDIDVKFFSINLIAKSETSFEEVNETQVRIQIGRRSSLETLTISSYPYTQDISLSRYDYSSTRHLINNAGSGIREDGTPYDRGFAQEDHGQFSQKEYIHAFCGCCVLIRRNIFSYRKLFVDEFFAYYEDSELSYWCNENNIPILYVPQAHVYHKHSEATSENSPSWQCMVHRSSLIYRWFREELEGSIYDLLIGDDRYLGLLNEISPQLRQILSSYDTSLIDATRDRLVTRTGVKSIAIYNTYMNSKGGGEKHILAIAQELSQDPGLDISIICERDFSLSELLSYFRLSKFQANRFITGKITPKLTAFYDCFINSTFLSKHLSLAKNSYYVVSFPGRDIPSSMKTSYTFLHNSDYTASWASRFWGDHRNMIIYPVLGEQVYHDQAFLEPVDRSLQPIDNRAKRKLIISIGRYNFGGHCKNQHIVVGAFKSLVENRKDLSHWKLRCMGSIDYNVEESRKHFEQTLRIAGDHPNIEVLGNVSSDLITESYQHAAVYVHATGLGADLDSHPEKAEHFGISVYEALESGCTCVVYFRGGPADMVAGLEDALLFESENDLIGKLESVLTSIDRREDQAISVEATNRAQHIREVSQKRISGLIQDLNSSSIAMP